MKKLAYASLIYAVLGLALGVFYREFTKLNQFQGYTQLRGLHVHVLTLGALFFLLVLVLHRLLDIGRKKGFSFWFILYHAGLAGTASAMLTRGILQVFGSDMAGLNHIAGLFHTLLGIAVVWFFVLVVKAAKD